MKLRNKKTGEIDDFLFDEVITGRIDLYRRVGTSETKNIWHYNSLAELNEEWEDAEDIDVPSMPLIKNEKVRKAVRAWAEANDVEEADYWNSVYRFQDAQGVSSISFESNPIETKNRYGNDVYTIAELCGEEEE